MLETIALIIVINVAYMTMTTLRLILVIKGYPRAASLLSMFEVFIYLIGLTMVLDDLSNPWNMAAYCLGWGLGVFIGSLIEGKLALGYVLFEIIINLEDADIVNELRSKGYGVTSWLADGKDGKKICMRVIAKRKNEKKLRKTVLEMWPKAFIISYEPSKLDGGFLVKQMKAARK
ncbi:DUF2179 domain-containing protein [Kurthia sibirica]|uniref:UPF0316 protein DEX24_09890 n=1 Tax=Kurthia sibirica TaxID=202750 RepID=A0A2U3AKI1_9BACL|nr:DUF2179 domain-containing protein [Kurthia sibirica]PWI25048.1 hypothetical protein DEX24_09890 [Kurthia sibirica]GEK34212.1 DUF2179 domain-containing protein [Kurthia sibirica]